MGVVVHGRPLDGDVQTGRHRSSPLHSSPVGVRAAGSISNAFIILFIYTVRLACPLSFFA